MQGWVSAEVRAHVCDGVNKMFVELLSYSYTSPKLLHVEKITFLIELLRIYIKSTEEI